ncbi:OsmC family protein [Ferdinandcohnia quinoae]|uniref:OsmC family protein n=1 Tax=Fredinandcohnia quinoae TaxID=2918902 RepID=A0AAW5DYA6_9BACI|nr:OsmC family protein [Fredinandcohnia sp. SECRCQ15]MCH1625621.1 OsmC family protein [Fredinandcohnia sp. SECRCQ15]
MLEYEIKDGLTSLQTEFHELHISPDPSIGIKPSELLVSSLVGCSSAILTKVLEKKRIKVDSIRVQASMERNPSEANRITKVDIHFIIEGKNISEEK